jgi:hypothetical protein
LSNRKKGHVNAPSFWEIVTAVLPHPDTFWDGRSVTPIFSAIYVYLPHMSKHKNNLMDRFFLSIAVAVILLICTFTIYLLKIDNIVYWASEDNPLDNKHSYVIKKNDGAYSKNGEPIIPAGITYVVVRSGEVADSISLGTSGKTVGKTDVDLEPYVGKEVYIIGEYYDGRILFISSQHVPDYLLEAKQAVIYIKALRLKP